MTTPTSIQSQDLESAKRSEMSSRPHEEDMGGAFIGEGQQSRPSEDTPTTPQQQAILPSPLDQLFKQAALLAKQLQRERADLQGSGRADGRLAVKALEQQVVQVWNAIRAARLSGTAETDTVPPRGKWK